jgi:hypothetical protein
MATIGFFEIEWRASRRQRDVDDEHAALTLRRCATTWRLLVNQAIAVGQWNGHNG